MITDPASIAWLLNIRGGDVPFTPFALGFALVHADGGAELFMDAAKLPEPTRDWLGNAVSVAGREALAPALARLARQAGAGRSRPDRRSGSRRRCAPPARWSWPAPTPACCRKPARTRSSSRAPAAHQRATRWRSAGSCTGLPRLRTGQRNRDVGRSQAARHSREQVDGLPRRELPRDLRRRRAWRDHPLPRHRREQPADPRRTRST